MLPGCVLAFVVLAAPALSPPAYADQPTDSTPGSPPTWGGVAGSLTALVPLLVGSALLANDSSPHLQRDGVYVITVGFAAAPWVAHGINHRWRRALGFGLVSLATSAASLVAMEYRDPFDPSVANHERLPFGFLFTSAFFAAAVGVIDSFVTGSPSREGR
ncbi:MAG TPA: hypothetical protein VFH73_08595 [Polyangia bacterium]|jgi:hypothetical protein|nr:hypothetical protein [Polyangia bacterium]